MKAGQGGWTTTHRRNARRLYRAGFGVTVVAEKTGVPRRTVHRWMIEDGIMRSRSEAEQLKRHGRIVFTPETEAAVVEARERSTPVRSICRNLGISEASVYSIVKRRRAMPTVSRSLGNARRWNNPGTPKGRARLDRIARLVALEQDGVSYFAMRAMLGVPQCAIDRMRVSPYADALRVMLYGGCTTPPRRDLARRMFWTQGLPIDLIARTLECDERTVNRWVHT